MKKSAFLRLLNDAARVTIQKSSAVSVNGLEAVQQAKNFGLFFPEPGEEHESRNPVVRTIYDLAACYNSGPRLSELVQIEEAWEYFEKHHMPINVHDQ